MIGNDIVDRRVGISERWKNPRYLNKIYTPLEQQYIFTSIDPKLMIQLLWSLKEATYKAHQRRYNLERCYNPIQFNCKIISELNSGIQGEILINNMVYFSHSKISTRFIHSSVTSEEKTKTTTRIIQKKLNFKQDLIAEFSRIYEEPQNIFSIKKNKHSIPFLFINGIKQDQDFSISHHGNFTSYSISLTNS